MMEARRRMGRARCLALGRRIGTVALGLSIAAVALLGGAAADDWGDTENNPIDGTGPTPDHGDHTYCFEPLDNSVIDNINAAENILNDTTHANVWLETTCDTSSGTETDVVWDTANLSGDTRGRTYCEDWDDGLCDQSYAELDVAKINEGANDELDTDKTACHELGHTVGLTHHNTGYGCMVNGGIPSTAVTWRRYATHHVYDHINAWF